MSARLQSFLTINGEHALGMVEAVFSFFGFAAAARISCLNGDWMALTPTFVRFLNAKVAKARGVCPGGEYEDKYQRYCLNAALKEAEIMARLPCTKLPKGRTTLATPSPEFVASVTPNGFKLPAYEGGVGSSFDDISLIMTMSGLPGAFDAFGSGFGIACARVPAIRIQGFGSTYRRSDFLGMVESGWGKTADADRIFRRKGEIWEAATRIDGDETTAFFMISLPKTDIKWMLRHMRSVSSTAQFFQYTIGHRVFPGIRVAASPDRLEQGYRYFAMVLNSQEPESVFDPLQQA